MPGSSEILKSAIAAAKKTLQSIVDLESQIAKAADLIADCLTNEKKVLACGNGGSAADAGSAQVDPARHLRNFRSATAARLINARQPSDALRGSQRISDRRF